MCAIYVDDDGNKIQVDTRRNWARVRELVRPYRGLLLNVCFGMICLSAVALAMPWPLKFLIDTVFPQGESAVGLVWIIVAGLALLHLFQAALQYFNGFMLRYVGNRLCFDLRRKLFVHLHRLSMDFFESQRTGSIMSRLTEDVSSINQLICGQSMTIITSIFKFFAAIIIIFLIDKRLGIAALAVMPLHVIAVVYFRPRVKSAARESRRNWARVCGVANETIAGAQLVKSFTSENREAKNFVKETRKQFGLNLQRGEWAAWWSITATVLHGLGKVIVIGYGGTLVLNGAVKPGTFVAFFSYTQMLHQPLIQLVSMLNQILPALVGVERVFEILETPPTVQEAPDAVAPGRLEGHVKFQNVHFSYEEKSPVLHGIDLTVEPGEVVAFVGPSGSGKTTLVNLIARFYDVSDGRILIDGQDIRRLRVRAYRDQIGMVLQENFLFSGSIEENIRYGKPTASREEVEEAARMANAYEFISEMEDGFKSEVGENGTRLSGGQRQRVAIGRAMLRDPRILILDEATSALDTESEMLVQDALKKLMKGRTTFVIAHRLSTVRSADKIVVLRQGQIVEAGTHEELLANEGLYYHLYRPEYEEEDDSVPYELMQVA